MNKLLLAALAALVGYAAGIAGPAVAQGPVRQAADVQLRWQKQATSAAYGTDVFAAVMLGADEVVHDARSWQLVRRAVPGGPRLVTCTVDPPTALEPLRLTLHDQSGMYVLRTGPVPSVTFSAAQREVLPRSP
jgi:hypothetical protein